MNSNENEKLIEDLFGDLFKNPPTKEEIEARKKEEEYQRQRAIESGRMFNAYAMTLPGAERVREDNPIVEIKGGIDENGKFFQRAITREERTEEFLKELDEIFCLDNLNNDNSSFHR